ncbi:MAG: DUF2179 domain-containing protein [Erysipelothrix sp.]|nr:DUF2179 domain-containing protein [Erysipelothrix sp.]
MTHILLILILQLCYVPMLALRTICMVKKLTMLTAFFGFLEAIIYVFGLALVLSGDQTTLAMVVYALGFSLGLIVGIAIENRIAIGFRAVQVNIKSENDQLINYMRSQGFGVTVFKGDGKEGARYMLDILAKRSREKELFDIIESYEPTAFIISYEPTRFKGGFIEQLMKKQSAKGPSRFDLNNKNIKGIKRFFGSVVNEVKELIKPKEDSV